MKQPKDIFEIFWAWVYQGVDPVSDEAIFHNTQTGLTISKPRLAECWHKDDKLGWILTLKSQSRPGYPNHPIAAMRIGEEAKEYTFKPGDRLIFPKQRQFLRLLPYFEFLSFGGAAGTGKSLVLEMSHIWRHLDWKRHGITNVTTGMFCETYPDLLDRQISKIPEWVPEYLGEWYEQKKTFRFFKKWGNGEQIYRTTENTMRLRSIEFGHATVDEGTQNAEIILDEIGSRLRSPKVTNPSYGLATNPGGSGTNWYRRRLVEPETRDMPTYSSQFNRWTKGAFHIQSLPTENPLLGPDYYANLERKAPHVRDAQLYGLWDTYEGIYYPMINPRVHRIQSFRIPDQITKFRFIDVGTSHPFVCLWVALFPPDADHPRGRLIVYRELSILEKHASTFKRRVLELETRHKDKNIMMTVLSFDAFSFKSSTMGDKTIGERFNMTDEYGPSLNCVPGPSSDRVGGARLISELLAWEGEDITNEDGNKELKIVSPPFIYFFNECKLTWNSMTNLIHDKNNPEDVQKTTKRIYYPGEGDDEFTALRDGMMTIELDDFLPQDYGEPTTEYGRTPDYYEEVAPVHTGYAVF